MAATCVPKLYRSIMDDVINNVREHFLDEGVDEQYLQELKQLWERKIIESKVIEPRKPEQVAEHNVLPVQTQTLQPMGQVTQTAQQISLSSGSLQQTYPFNSDVIHAGPKSMTITLPAQGGHGPLQTVLSAPSAAATLALPPEIVTASLFPQLRQGTVLNNAQTLQSDHTSTRIQYQPLNADFSKQQFAVAIGQPPVSSQPIQQQTSGIIQLDGANDTSDDDDDDSHEEIQDEDDEQIEEDENEEEEEPLNSDDDVSDEDATEQFDTENVVVCQYDKITRTRNRWKFHLKDGIMNLKGKDYVFQKANGDAEW